MATADADKKQVLFIQGGGEGGYEADAKLVSSLRAALGTAYTVQYPRMHVEDKPDFGWGPQIGKAIAASKSGVALVGHSLGASMLVKYIAEHEIKNQIAGIFLISTPFWGAAHEGLALQEGFADRLPNDVPIFLYYAIDDEEVGVAHADMYAQKLPRATVRKIARGGHQLGNDLTPVAKDIASLG
jgi:predicted alpha/beta hydrolase family esterase